MDNKKIYILNFAWEHTNYGAILTAFALQSLVKKYSNLENLIVNNIDARNLKTTQKFTFGESFKYKYMKFTNHINNYEKTLKLTEDGEIFITGSDQVFRIAYNDLQSYQYFLDFVNTNRKKIAFSASFGVDKATFLRENSTKQIERIKQSLKTFDFISVREESGADICKDILDVDAQIIIDPVFIVNKNIYEEFINNSCQKYKNKIVSYILNRQNDFDKELKLLEKKYNTKIIDTSFKNISISEWLTSIKSCKFIITDSFHAVCFAIIFNKPFICLTNPGTGNARYQSLFKLLGLKYESLSNLKQICDDNSLFKDDYTEINKNIEYQQKMGIDFLNKSLNYETKITEEKLMARIALLENRLEEYFNKLSLKYILGEKIQDILLIVYHCYLPKSICKIISYWKKRREK